MRMRTLVRSIGLVVATFTDLTVSHSAHKHVWQRGIGKAASSVIEYSTEMVTVPIPVTSSNCATMWRQWSADIHQSTITETVIVTASVSNSSSDHAMISPLSTSSQDMSIRTTSSVFSPASMTANVSNPPSFMNLSSIIAISSSATSSATYTIPTSMAKCPMDIFNMTEMPHYFGFNVVNQKPTDPFNTSEVTSFKAPDDWETAFALLKQNFPDINAIRMYSTTDGETTHLMNAMPAAQNHNLSFLVGIWSTGNGRFTAEKQALENVITRHGCGNIAAISVGNEDLNQVNVVNAAASDEEKSSLKQGIANALVDQISEVRNMTRSLGCCSIPITHTDTWNEFTNTQNPWVPDLIRACDQAAIVNIFPYWSQAQVITSWQMMRTQASRALTEVKEFGKDLWLGETGWAISQPHGAGIPDAQQYFSTVGCQILSGSGTAFYYVDWDQDAPKNGNPSFGLFDHLGRPQLPNLTCDNFKPDMGMKDFDNLPAFMGISQAQR